MKARLGIESASARLSVAARRSDGRVAERELTGPRSHAGALGRLVREVLAELGLGIDRVEAIALSDGPGSFTGLRVGAAFVKGLAGPGRIPIWTASTLLVRAAGAANGAGPDRVVAGVGSALRGELYAAVYRIGGGGPIECLAPPGVLRPGEAPGLDVPVEVVAGDLGPDGLAAWPWTGSARRRGPPDGVPRAAVLIGLAGRAGGLVRLDHPDDWEPWYGRPAEAQARWEREHGRPLVAARRDG